MKVLAFGIAREIFGSATVEVAAGSASTAAELQDVLKLQYPRLAQLSSFMIAVNGEYAQPGTTINEGDEVAIIPPVSGG